MTRLLTVALAALLLAGCGGTAEPAADDDTTQAAVRTAPAPAADPVQQFLEVTAEHVCEVQGTIYDTPAELAEAYDATPDYPGLDGSEVTRLQKRLETDADFSGELNERVAESCG